MRLGFFTTNPIHYFVPFWRLLSGEVELQVFFFSDAVVRGAIDPEFGIPVNWGVPLLEGYPSRFLQRDADLSRPGSVCLRNARELLQKERLDAVMVRGYAFAFEAQVLRAAKRLGLSTFVRGEFTDLPRPEGRSLLKATLREAYLRWFFSKVDAVCCIGEEARRFLRRRRIPEERLFSSPYSVDTALLEEEKTRFLREEVRRELGIPPRGKLLLFCGKLIPRKDPLLILDALSRIPDREEIWLALVGDGQLRPELERRGRALLGERLILPGFVAQPDLGRFFSAADVFVFPSRYETWGLVVNEALQFGLPVICGRNVGSAADLVLPEETGLLIPTGRADALAAAIECLLRDEALRRRLGENGRRRVEGYRAEDSVAGVRQALDWLTRGSRRG